MTVEKSESPMRTFVPREDSNGRYILNGKIPIPCPDLVKWARGFEQANRIVCQTQISKRIRVSTVFLGIDHNFGGGGLPLLFETMVFGGRHDDFQERYSTWDDAEEGHERIVQMATPLWIKFFNGIRGGTHEAQ